MVIAAFVLATNAAGAQDPKKNEFGTEIIVSRCREFAESKVTPEGVRLKTDFDNGFCFGLFAMTLRTIMTADRATGDRVLGICAPEGSSTTQLAKVFVQFADAHPQRLNENFYPVLLEALHKAFPCPKNRR